MAPQAGDTQKRVDHQERVGESRQAEDSIQRPTNGHDYKEGLTPSERLLYFTKFDMVDDTLKPCSCWNESGYTRIMIAEFFLFSVFFSFLLFCCIYILRSSPYHRLQRPRSLFALLPVVSFPSRAFFTPHSHLTIRV